MTCIFCKHEMIETTMTYFQELENTMVIIKNVPCCGNKLELIAPSTDLLPRRVKETTGGRQYYFVSARKILAYTTCPN